MNNRQLGLLGFWLLLGGIALSCGADDGKKRSQGAESGAGGALGEAGSGESPDAGGSANVGGEASTPSDGGTGSGEVGGSSGNDAAGAGGGATEPEPNPLDRWLDPAAGADTNDGTSAPVAFRTLSHALSEMESGGTLWLLDGTIGAGSGEPSTGGYTTLDIPDGVNVRAVNDGAVTIGEGLAGANPPSFQFLGSGSLRGVSFDGVAIPIKASTGVVELEALTFANSGGGCDSFTRATLDLSGDVQVTLTAGSVTEYAGPGSNVRNFAYLADSASLHVIGGSFTELAAGGCTPRNHFGLVGSAKLELTGVDIADAGATDRGGVVGLVGPNTELVMTDSSIDGGPASAPAIYADGGGSPHITLVDSSITNNTVAGLQLGSENGPLSPVMSLSNTTISNNRYGFLATGVYGPATVDLTITDSTIVDNDIAAFHLTFGGTIDIEGGELSRNGDNQDTYWGTYGGLYLNSYAPSHVFDVKLRGVSVNDTPSFGGLTTAGVLIRATAGSTIDLGTVDDAGDNTFTGSVRTGVELMTGNAATVSAVGNTWNPSVQAASAAGKYTAPAGTQTSVTSGTGTNYIVTAGTLILAETP